MTRRSTERWDDGDCAYSPRPFIAHRLSGLDGEDQSWLGTDIDTIKTALEMLMERRDILWDPFFARDQVPIPSDGADTPDVRGEIQGRNRRASQRSDCLIIHAYQNGSTYLGHLQARFLQGPILRPVLVLRHRRSGSFSRAWHGLEQDHPNLDVVTFEDSDLVNLVFDWFSAHANEIEASAAARRQLDAKWKPVCEALVRAIGGESPDVRAALSRALNLTPRALHELVSSPMALAALGAEHLCLLQQRYGSTIELSLALAAAREHLSDPEFEAWQAYRGEVGEARAQATLVGEMRLREEVGIFRNRPRLVTLDAWMRRERGLKRGQ